MSLLESNVAYRISKFVTWNKQIYIKKYIGWTSQLLLLEPELEAKAKYHFIVYWRYEQIKSYNKKEREGLSYVYVRLVKHTLFMLVELHLIWRLKS